MSKISILYLILVSIVFSNVSHARDTPNNLIQNVPLAVDFHGNDSIYYQASDKDHTKTIQIYRIAYDIFAQQVDIENTGYCKNIDLTVYLLEDDTINNRDVMSFLNWNSWQNKDIWGAYHRVNSRNIRAIFINTSATTNTLYRSIFHELHHWTQDLSCIDLNESDTNIFTEDICLETGMC